MAFVPQAHDDAISADRVVEIAQSICSIPSPSGEERRVAELICEILESAGAEVYVEDVVPSRPNVVAAVGGTGSRKPLVLNGHLDTSVYQSGWSSDPFRPWISEGRLYGGGITDMKGSIAAMVACVEAAASMSFKPPGDLVLQGVIHHDTIGLGTKYAMAADAPREGYGICGEPSNLAIHTTNAGAVKFEIQLTGRVAHVSRKSEGIDTIGPALRLCEYLQSVDLPHEPDDRLPALPILNIGRVEGGEAPALVAESTTLEGDVRTVPGMDRFSVGRFLREVADQIVPNDIGVRVRILAVQRPFLGDSQGALAGSLAEAHQAVVGSPAAIDSQASVRAFVTDAADMAAAGLETVVYGVGDWRFGPDESVSIDALAANARVLFSVAFGFGG